MNDLWRLVDWGIDILKKLKQLSPVPVKFVHDTDVFLGRYCDRGKYEEYPCIKIINCLDNHEKIAVLTHEIGHALCYKKGCECTASYDDYIKREIHAFKYSLNWLLKNEQKESLHWSIMSIKAFLNRYDHYAKVAEHIMKLKLWQKCLDYVGD